MQRVWRRLLQVHDRNLVKEASAFQPAADAHRCRHELVLGIGERKRRRYRGALVHLEKARTLCLKVDEARSRRASLWEQRVRAIRRDGPGTRKLAAWYESRWPDHSYVDDLWVLHARALEKRNQKEAAQ